MSLNRKKILIGFLNKDVKGAIPTVTKAFIEGLADKYDFIPFYMDRLISKKHTKMNLINIFYFFKHYISWIYHIIRYRPDIVHYPVTSYWNSEKSLLFLFTAKLLLVKKNVGHLHGGAYDSFWASLHPIRKKFNLFMLCNLDAFVVLSEFWREVAINKIGLKESKVFLVNNPISRDVEDHFIEHIRNYKSGDTVNVVSIGAVTERKGIMDTIEALKSINNIKYTYSIIGNVIEEAFREKILLFLKENEMLDRVKLLGPKYNKDKIDILEKADIFILASHIENFPLVVIEAASAGLAIIATPIGALPEFFKHGENIYFVEQENVHQLMQGIEQLANDDAEREKLGKNAREIFCEKLNRVKIMKQLEAVYDKI
ncbi:MAG: glycosyltransferase family 4 protein [Candidatus Delongbacteria bacterium]